VKKGREGEKGKREGEAGREIEREKEREWEAGIEIEREKEGYEGGKRDTGERIGRTVNGIKKYRCVGKAKYKVFFTKTAAVQGRQVAYSHTQYYAVSVMGVSCDVCNKEE
jgi:hypothetical protein